MSGNKERFYRIMIHPIFLWSVGILIAALVVIIFADVPISRLFVMTEHFMYEYENKTVDKKELLSSIGMVRIPMLLLLTLLHKSTNREFIKTSLCLLCGFSMGYLFFRLAENYGFKGIVMCLLLWTPHIFLYLFSAYGFMYKTESSLKKKVVWCLVFLIGILLEAYFNPILMESFVTVYGKY